MKFIKKILYNREINKIKKRISSLQEKAMQHQRDGNLREYASVTSKLEELSDYLVEKMQEQE